jgi:putative transposase
VTYCVLANHFHSLVGVPRRPAVPPINTERVQRVRDSLGDLEATRLEQDLALADRTRSPGWEAEIRERYLRRTWDISLFMKTLKQRFSQWFNKVHRRRGTLWEGRFRSVLVESVGSVLRTMAAYIDLNPVRAGLMAEGGRLPANVYLRCRVRYLTEGAVVGSRGYVNGVFEAVRERFGVRRRSGARLMRGLEEKLYALRDVKRGAVA